MSSDLAMIEVSSGSHQLKRRRCGLVLTYVISFEGLYWFWSFFFGSFRLFRLSRSDSFGGFRLASMVSARAYIFQSAGCRRNYDGQQENTQIVQTVKVIKRRCNTYYKQDIHRKI